MRQSRAAALDEVWAGADADRLAWMDKAGRQESAGANLAAAVETTLAAHDHHPACPAGGTRRLCTCWKAPMETALREFDDAR